MIPLLIESNHGVLADIALHQWLIRDEVIIYSAAALHAQASLNENVACLVRL